MINTVGRINSVGRDQLGWADPLSRAVASAARPSPRPVRPSPSVVVPATETGAPSTSDSTFSASARRMESRGLLAITCTEALVTVNPAAQHPGEHLGQQRRSGCSGPARIIGAENRAEVAQPGRAEQCIAQRVRGDVTVGMPGASVDAREKQSGDPAVPARLDRVHVDPGADPDRGGSNRRPGHQSLRFVADRPVW